MLTNSSEVNKRIDQLSKKYYGTITSTLAKNFGHENLIQIDNLVSKSFKHAKNRSLCGTARDYTKDMIWQFITDNSGDLFCTKVKNRSSSGTTNGNYSSSISYPNKDEATENNIIMLFACCHGSISLDIRMAMILKILGGYTSSDIARVLSKNETTTIDEIKKAKIEVVSGNIPFEIPGEHIINDGLDRVLESISLIFELGFNHPSDRSKIFPELCYTAINLLQFLVSHPKTNSPKSRALTAYMLLCASRLEAMKDDKGNLLGLREQNRCLWKEKMIRQGIDYLYSSTNGIEVSIYHLKAGVAAVHSTSLEYKMTNWKHIISLYDHYLKLDPCPKVELEKAIALSKCYGPEEGLKCIDAIQDRDEIKDNVLLLITLGSLNIQIHNYEKANNYLKRASKISKKASEKTYINNKINICEQRIRMTRRYKYGTTF